MTDDSTEAGVKREREGEQKLKHPEEGRDLENPPIKKTKTESIIPTNLPQENDSNSRELESHSDNPAEERSKEADTVYDDKQVNRESPENGKPQASQPSPTALANSSRIASRPPQPPETPVDPGAAPTVTNPNSIVEERAEISALYVGKVIGKGGEMLRDLQARSGCRLDVDQNVPHGNPRILTYRGTRKTVDLAKQMVHVLCTPQGNEGSLPLGEATRKNLIVPASSVGKIIGRAGEMVRELQSRSQAKIQVDHTNKAVRSDTRSVSIIGTPDAVTKAEEMILFLVANPLLDAMKAIGLLVDDKLQKGGRWGSGPPYINMPNNGQNMQPVEGVFSTAPPSHQYGGYQQGALPPGHGYGGPPPPMHQAYDPYYSNRGPETEIFPAAKMYMGRVIGQKGVTINDLQKRSGCDIQINQDVPPGQDCIITIKGNRHAIEMAKQMLREIIEMGPSHPYAGGGGQYQGQGYNSNVYLQQQQSGPYLQQPVMQSGYQPNGQQVFGHHQPTYGHVPSPQQYAQPQVNYGMGPYESTGYQQLGAPGYGAPPPRQPPINGPVSIWKSATAADGQVYYYNEKTGETQWDKPIGMP